MKKIAFLFLTAILLTGCPLSSVQFGETFWLKFNATALISDDSLQLSFIDVEDSRCPVDVVCVWEGEAKVTLLARYGDSDNPVEETLQLTLNANDQHSTVTFGDYQLRLFKVRPYPDSRIPTDKKDYKIELAANKIGQITDITWQLESYRINGEEPTELIDGTEYSLYLDSNSNQARGDILCNRWMSGYQISNAELTLENMATTKMFCQNSDNEGAKIQTKVFVDVLAGPISSWSNDGRLTLSSSKGDELHFTAETKETLVTFTDSLKLWQSSGINHYSFTFSQSCYCLFIGSGNIHVTVKDGVIINAYDMFNTQPLTDKDIAKLKTIDELFTVVKKAIKLPADSINASYDKQYGFPNDVYLDYNEMIADEEYGFTVENFKPLR
ncbi:MAG: META domain-containing protein [Gammaproteobacteria bacterium]|nr:META domain-containing protein [Gammaproteobacteria bacterium]